MNQSMKIPATRRQTSIQIPHQGTGPESWIAARSDLFAIKSEILKIMEILIVRSLKRSKGPAISGVTSRLRSCADDAGEDRVTPQR